MKRGNYKPWTLLEERILKENYNEPWDILMSLLPGRTKHSIRNRAYHLKLYRRGPNPNQVGYKTI